MKRVKFLGIIIALLVTVTNVAGLCACFGPTDKYDITINTNGAVVRYDSIILEVGDEVDYTKYFTVTDKNGMNVTVTNDMLDLKNANTGSEGSFSITLKVGNSSKTLWFMVVSKGTDVGSGTGPVTENGKGYDTAPLQAKLKAVDGNVGLPSIGDYHALVVPVQFTDNTITPTQLANLEIAFNGTEAQTGWESVRTYYQKSSYGKLNLSFDIQSVYKAKYSSSYYNGSSLKDSYGNKNGNEVILKEVLAGLNSTVDFSKYDTNGDGCIDAVYLIYSASVSYSNSDDSIYWAYVTWDENNTKYDGKDANYYLFAGFDFMDESVSGKDHGSGYPTISGLKVNASTYIHETGHLLGLDDYYDYDTSRGCNYGLGGADMMDYTVGDQNVYSKTMLGWMTPTVASGTATITIQSSQAKGDSILVPLNYNNTYFSEYLMIDLYSAQGLNKMHANMSDTYLYGGASYGVRIYHVSSSANNPWSDNNYSSLTDYNNTSTNTALIKLIEADGGRSTSKTDNGAWAVAKDLWTAGKSLNSVFPSYTSNNGTKLKFNVTVDSVSANSATITIKYN